MYVRLLLWWIKRINLFVCFMINKTCERDLLITCLVLHREISLLSHIKALSNLIGWRNYYVSKAFIHGGHLLLKDGIKYLCK